MYNLSGFDSDTAKSILPIYLLSKPISIFFHVLPASTDLYAPPLDEPLIIVQGFLSALQEAAYIVFGSSGANSISTIPIESDR